MTTNIIEGFEIENDLKITDGAVSISTNDIAVSLDISSNLTIGTILDNHSNKLIIKNKDKAEINLISKNSLDTESIHKISNKNGGLLFESDNTAINYTRYEFDVGGGESVGIMKGSVDNFSGIIFGKNSDETEGITNYVTPHLGYKHDDKILMFTSEQYKFNLSNDNFQTLQPFSTLDSNGLSIGIEHPINRLSIFGNNDTDVSMCIVAVGDDSYPSSGIWLGTQFSSSSDTMTKTAIICDQTGTSGGGTAKLHFCLDDSTSSGDANISHSKVTIQPNGNLGIGTTTPEKLLDVNGDMVVQELNVSDSIKIVNNAVNTILLDISGVSAIRIPSGDNNQDKFSMVLNSNPGYMRFNTTLNQFEGYDGSNWTSLGGVRSLNQNTYIDANNTNGLTFFESSVGKMNIKNGNICFGNIDPSYNFHFSGSTNSDSSIVITNSSSTNDVYLSLQINDDDSAQLLNSGNNNLIIATNNQITNNNPQLFLNSTNNYIGIGTNNPLGMLYINDTQEIANNIVLNLFSTAFSTGKSYTILKLEKGAGYGGSIKGFIDQGVGSGLEFSTYNGDTENTAMTILNNGNIGIGMESPNNKLVIDGGIYHTSSSKDIYYDTSSFSYSTVITGGNQFQRSSGSQGTSTNYEAQPILILKRPGYSTGSQMKPAAVEFKVGQVETFYDYPKSKLQIDLLGGGGDSLGAVNVMTLQHDLKVGIGTSSPDRQLDIETTDTGTGWNSSLVVGNTTNKFIAGVFNNEILIGGHNASLNAWRNMRINDNGNVKICTSSGNVGIGNGLEGDPEYKLDLRKKNSSNATSYIYLDCGNGGPGTANYDQGESVTSGDAGGGLYWKPYYDVGSNTYSKHSAAIRFRQEGNYFRGGLDFMTNDTTDTSTDCLTRLRIAGNGWTTVGSTAPEAPLSITTSGYDFNSSQTLGIHMGVFNDTYSCINMVSDHLGGPWIDFKPTSRHGTTYSDKHGRIRYNMEVQNGTFQLFTNNSLRYVFNGNGHVGINVTSPTYPLQVGGYTNSTNGSVQPYYMWRYGYTAGEGVFSSSGHYEYVSIKAEEAVLADRFVVISDKRIKTNIEEVPDNLSLEKIRKIECKYYDYIDSNVRGTNRTIGFIAQQVREHMPMAVAIVKDFIPDKMCLLKKISWSESDDKFIMSTPELTDVSGVEYRFYVSENTKSDEIIVELIGNSDNTFTFDKQWKVIFCYGKKVDDFHTLDKQKLFALNFSATQEIDKNQQTLISEQKQLKETVKRQNDIIFELTSKIEGLMSRITQLEQIR